MDFEFKHIETEMIVNFVSIIGHIHQRSKDCDTEAEEIKNLTFGVSMAKNLITFRDMYPEAAKEYDDFIKVIEEEVEKARRSVK